MGSNSVVPFDSCGSQERSMTCLFVTHRIETGIISVEAHGKMMNVSEITR